MENMPVPLVMLVDDNPTDNFISKRIIELSKFADDVVVKNSGKSALEYLTQHQEDESKLPDLIFLDINMPVVDGFVFLYEFENNYPDLVKQKCRITILSSSDNKSDIEKIVNNEFVIDFITKPLNEKSLNRVKEGLIKNKNKA